MRAHKDCLEIYNIEQCRRAMQWHSCLANAPSNATFKSIRIREWNHRSVHLFVDQCAIKRALQIHNIEQCRQAMHSSLANAPSNAPIKSVILSSADRLCTHPWPMRHQIRNIEQCITRGSNCPQTLQTFPFFVGLLVESHCPQTHGRRRRGRKKWKCRRRGRKMSTFCYSSAPLCFLSNHTRWAWVIWP